MTTFTNSEHEVSRRRDVDDLEHAVRPDHVHRRRLPIPCTEPRILGNLLTDPGFESILADTGGGSEGDEISTFAYFYDYFLFGNVGLSGSYQYWRDKAFAPFNHWTQSDGGGSPSPSSDRVHVSTSNPRTGAYHVRWGSNAAFGDVVFSQQQLCTLGDPASADLTGQWGGQYSARVDPGDTVTWGAFLEASTGTNTVRIRASYWKQDQSSAADFFPDYTIGTTYAYRELVTVAPADAYYVVVSIQLRTFITSLDADDFVFTIT